MATVTINDLKMADKNKYGMVLQELLYQISLQQKEFAELTGIDKAVINRHIKGFKMPRSKNREIIYNVLSDLLPKETDAKEALEQKYEAKPETETPDDGWELAKAISAMGYSMREQAFGIGDFERFMNQVPMKHAKRMYENYRKNLIKPGVIAMYKDTVKCLVTKVDHNFATIFVPETGLCKEANLLDLKKNN